MIVEELERHRDTCRACKPGAVCAVAAGMLEQLAMRLLPASPIELIDLPGHVAACTRCRGQRLCEEGRQIADRRTDAWLDAAVSAWGKPRLGSA